MNKVARSLKKICLKLLLAAKIWILYWIWLMKDWHKMIIRWSTWRWHLGHLWGWIKSSSKICQVIQENGSKEKDKVRELSVGLMVVSIQANGKTIVVKVRANWSMRMEVYIKDNFIRTRLMAKVCLFIQMVPGMRGNGETIFRKVMGLWVGRMVRNTWAFGRVERSRAKARCFSRTEVFTVVNLVQTKSMV